MSLPSKLLCYIAVALLAGRAAHAETIEYSSGGGFFVQNDGYLVTGAHVIAPCDEYRAYEPSASYPVELVARDDKADLALLKSMHAVRNVAQFRYLQCLKPGDALKTAGYPGDAWKTNRPVVGEAKLLSATGMSNEEEFMQFDGAISYGNSGGPIFDEGGRVLGVVQGKGTVSMVDVGTYEVKSERKADIAISALKVVSFLQNHGVTPRVYDENFAPLGDDPARVAREITVNIRCEVVRPVR